MERGRIRSRSMGDTESVGSASNRGRHVRSAISTGQDNSSQSDGTIGERSPPPNTNHSIRMLYAVRPGSARAERVVVQAGLSSGIAAVFRDRAYAGLKRTLLTVALRTRGWTDLLVAPLGAGVSPVAAAVRIIESHLV